ncbi:MAG: IPT/TIG domain-containing protein, partial [Actinomycetes bacterium]
FQWACPNNPYDYTCVPQLGTANVLDTLGDRLMNRFAYRKIGAQESFIVSHSVDVAETTSTRWYEFRPSGSTLSLYQSNTYNPNAKHRWMPSVAMDRMGNIAMVYSVSSASMNPSIALAAHSYDASLGVIDTGETTLKAGTGSQTGDLTRWGDYAAIAVDPDDDCTFWSASQYIASNGEFNWQTWISKYKLANCTPPAPEISSITSSGAIGSTITISGSVLAGVNQVKIGGVGASSVKAVSATSVTAVVAPGTTGGQVWISNSSAQTALSSASFTLTYPNTTATNIKPSSAKVGATLTISGSNLDQVSALTIGGVSQPVFTATASNLYAAVPSGVSAGSARVVQLTTPNGTVNAASGITVTSGLTAPASLRLSPSRGAIGSTVTITGKDLASASAVKFGNTSATFTVTNGGTIVAAVPSAASGSAPVTVTTPGGTSSSVSFSIQTPASAPTISSSGVSPTSAKVGNLISVTGSNLAGVTGITFNSVPVTRFTIVSGTQLTFYVPEGATTGSFTITTVGGSVTYSSTVTIY